VPALAAIMVGDDPASRQYVLNKRRVAAEVGLKSEVIQLDAATPTLESNVRNIPPDRAGRDG